MAKYIFALHEVPGGLNEATPEEIQAVIGKYVGWREELAAKGTIIGGEKLADEGGKWLAREDSGIVVSDGPYSEAKEIMAGFFLVSAEDYGHAVAIARSCPHLDYGRIEVREIEEVH